jgi:hypothetical protein
MVLSRARRLAAALLAASLALGAGQARAWNNHGHMLVAAVAWQALTPAARARVARLLTLNPSYGAWTSGVPEPEKAQVAFMKAATWPDAIRHEPGYVTDSIARSGADAARNIGYADHLVHPYWHYRDEAFSTDGAPTRPAEVPNASTQIEAFAAALGASASDEVKSYDLVWLEHLVGDVHQPLHAVSRYTREFPGGDHGGNLEKVCEAQACTGSLHGYWDGALGRDEAPSEILAEAAALPPAPDALAAVMDDRVWLQESATIARNTAYAAPIGPGADPYQLTPEYEAVARQVARGRAALAGRRLARLIETALR